MRAPLRKTGIDFLGEIAWGAHLCLFYKTKQDLLETVVPYFKVGLEENEFCLWAVSDPVTVDDAKAALTETIPDFREYFAAGSMEIIPDTLWYLNAEEFDLHRLKSGWRKKCSDALSGGYAGMRASGNAFWNNTKHWDEFTEYEQELSHAITDLPLALLCTYALPESRATDVLDVVKAHELTVARRSGNWEIIGYPPMATESAMEAAAAIARLTPREREVLTHLSYGARNKETAARLGISDSTVAVYRSRIMLKLKVRNLPELIRLATVGGIEGSGAARRTGR